MGSTTNFGLSVGAAAGSGVKTFGAVSGAAGAAAATCVTVLDIDTPKVIPTMMTTSVKIMVATASPSVFEKFIFFLSVRTWMLIIFCLKKKDHDKKLCWSNN